MTGHRIGIDGGSTLCKIALIGPLGELLDRRVAKAGWQPAVTAEKLLDELIEQHGLNRKEVSVVCTGYTRESILFADKTLTEITAHAKGAVYLREDIRGVIDIGGQDSKVISLNGGVIKDFMMNDKCAAGTGRFVEMAMRTLECEPDDVDKICDREDYASINSMCTVFAESEIIGLIAKGVDRGKILEGVMRSIALRISQMLARTEVPRDGILIMTGGLSKYTCLIEAIKETSGYEVIAHADSLYAGAIGAALSS